MLVQGCFAPRLVGRKQDQLNDSQAVEQHP
jgi:hypothetical protein